MDSTKRRLRPAPSVELGNLVLVHDEVQVEEAPPVPLPIEAAWTLDCDRMDTVQEGEPWKSDESDAESRDESGESNSWGSEFDVDPEALDDVDIDADSSMSVMDLIHKVYWKGEPDMEGTQSADGSGRIEYLTACRVLQTRPIVPAALGLSETSLLLQHLNLGSKECQALAAGLASNTYVKELDLSQNLLGDVGSTALAGALRTNKFIEILHLRESIAGRQSGSAWAKTLQTNETLTYVDMRSCKLGDTSVSMIADAMRRNRSSSIKYLNLSDNQVGCKGAKSLASLISRDLGLTHLDVSWNQILPNDLRQLCRAIAGNSTLTILSLAWNGIGDQINKVGQLSGDTAGQDEEQHAIIDLVCNTKSIKDLDITNCRLGSYLGKDLAKAIANNVSIRNLKLDGNPLGDSALDVQKVLDARIRARSMDKFSIINCSLDPLRRIEYDSSSIGGFYRLDLSQPQDLEICKKLVKDAKASHGEAWRNERLNGARFTYPADQLLGGRRVAQNWQIPAAGILEIDVISQDDPDEGSVVFESRRFKLFISALETLNCDNSRLALLKRACQSCCFTASQALRILYLFPLESWRENALVLMFQCVVDKGSLYLCNSALSERSRLLMQKRIGPFFMMNRYDPAGKYLLDLGKQNDLSSFITVLSMQLKRPGSRFLNIRHAGNPQEPFVPIEEGSMDWSRLISMIQRSLAEPTIQSKGTLEFDFEYPAVSARVVDSCLLPPIQLDAAGLTRSRQGSRDGVRPKSRIETDFSERKLPMAFGSGGMRSESRQHQDKPDSRSHSAAGSRPATATRPITGSTGKAESRSSSRLRFPEVLLDHGSQGSSSRKAGQAPSRGSSSKSMGAERDCLSTGHSSTRSPGPYAR